MMHVTSLSKAEFDQVCHNISNIGKKDQIKIVRKNGKNEITSYRPSCWSCLWTWFIKPTNCRYANVSQFTVNFFQTHQKFITDNPLAQKAIARLQFHWKNKSCEKELEALNPLNNIFQNAGIKAQLEDQVQKTKDAAASTQAEAIEIVRKALANAKDIEENARKQAAVNIKTAAETQHKVEAIRLAAENAAKQITATAEKRALEILHEARSSHNLSPATKNEQIGAELLADTASMDCTLHCSDGSIKAHWLRLKKVDHFFAASRFPSVNRKDQDVRKNDDDKEKGSLEPAVVKARDDGLVKDFYFTDVIDKDSKLNAEGGYKVAVVMALRQHLYGQPITLSSIDQWLELHKLADYIQMKELQKICITNLMIHIRRNPPILFDILPALIESNHPATPSVIDEFILHSTDSDFNAWNHIPEDKKLGLYNSIRDKFDNGKTRDKYVVAAFALLYYVGIGTVKNIKYAFELFVYAHEKGHVLSTTYLAHFHLTGTHIAVGKDEGLRLLQNAVVRGCPMAQMNLGTYLIQGTIIGQDRVRGMQLVKDAANQGLSCAQYVLGAHHETGTPPNPKLAFRYYEEAAQQGYLAAEHKLGLCYNSGTGVTADRDKAIFWFTKAALRKYQVSIQSLINLGAPL